MTSKRTFKGQIRPLRSHAPTRASSCEGKKRYSKTRSKAVAKLMSARGESMHPYPCRYCQHWHVGHNFGS